MMGFLLLGCLDLVPEVGRPRMALLAVLAQLDFGRNRPLAMNRVVRWLVRDPESREAAWMELMHGNDWVVLDKAEAQGHRIDLPFLSETSFRPEWRHFWSGWRRSQLLVMAPCLSAVA